MHHRHENGGPKLVHRQKVYQIAYVEATGDDLVQFHIVEGDCECML